LSLYPKIFGYSLGGYSHRERWARTRWYYWVTLRSHDMKEGTLSLRLYSKKDFFDYGLGGYSHQERWACTRRCFIMNNEGE
jgi:hypothetical protein